MTSEIQSCTLNISTTKLKMYIKILRDDSNELFGGNINFQILIIRLSNDYNYLPVDITFELPKHWFTVGN